MASELSARLLPLTQLPQYSDEAAVMVRWRTSSVVNACVGDSRVRTGGGSGWVGAGGGEVEGGGERRRGGRGEGDREIGRGIGKGEEIKHESRRKGMRGHQHRQRTTNSTSNTKRADKLGEVRHQSGNH